MDGTPVLGAVERSKRGKNQPVTCRILGCEATVTDPYFKRFQVCPLHLRADGVFEEGELMRFCQQHNKFQPVDDFDGKNRSCRESLERKKQKNNQDRRSQQQHPRRTRRNPSRSQSLGIQDVASEKPNASTEANELISSLPETDVSVSSANIEGSGLHGLVQQRMGSSSCSGPISIDRMPGESSKDGYIIASSDPSTPDMADARALKDNYPWDTYMSEPSISNPDDLFHSLASEPTTLIEQERSIPSPHTKHALHVGAGRDLGLKLGSLPLVQAMAEQGWDRGKGSLARGFSAEPRIVSRSRPHGGSRVHGVGHVCCTHTDMCHDCEGRIPEQVPYSMGSSVGIQSGHGIHQAMDMTPTTSYMILDPSSERRPSFDFLDRDLRAGGSGGDIDTAACISFDAQAPPWSGRSTDQGPTFPDDDVGGSFGFEQANGNEESIMGSYQLASDMMEEDQSWRPGGNSCWMSMKLSACDPGDLPQDFLQAMSQSFQPGELVHSSAARKGCVAVHFNLIGTGAIQSTSQQGSDSSLRGLSLIEDPLLRNTVQTICERDSTPALAGKVSLQTQHQLVQIENRRITLVFSLLNAKGIIPEITSVSPRCVASGQATEMSMECVLPDNPSPKVFIRFQNQTMSPSVNLQPGCLEAGRGNEESRNSNERQSVHLGEDNGGSVTGDESCCEGEVGSTYTMHCEFHPKVDSRGLMQVECESNYLISVPRPVLVLNPPSDGIHQEVMALERDVRGARMEDGDLDMLFHDVGCILEFQDSTDLAAKVGAKSMIGASEATIPCIRPYADRGKLEYQEMIAKKLRRNLALLCRRGLPNLVTLISKEAVQTEAEWKSLSEWRDSKGWGLLHLAVLSGNLETIDALVGTALAFGNPIFEWDVRGPQGITPLHLVAAQLAKNPSILNIIPASGQEAWRLWWTVKTEDNLTPSDFAKLSGDDSMNKAVEERLAVFENEVATKSRLDYANKPCSPEGLVGGNDDKTSDGSAGEMACGCYGSLRETCPSRIKESLAARSYTPTTAYEKPAPKQTMLLKFVDSQLESSYVRYAGWRRYRGDSVPAVIMVAKCLLMLSTCMGSVPVPQISDLWNSEDPIHYLAMVFFVCLPLLGFSWVLSRESYISWREQLIAVARVFGCFVSLFYSAAPMQWCMSWFCCVVLFMAATVAIMTASGMKSQMELINLCRFQQIRFQTHLMVVGVELGTTLFACIRLPVTIGLGLLIDLMSAVFLCVLSCCVMFKMERTSRVEFLKCIGEGPRVPEEKTKLE
ncbi:hypothetical protein BSKO_05828 [Bryopsis sp. KO-2023]|nr:hypothetical protein BSKO_05828 [Bryopsis sp. KO-2023]